MKRLFFVTLLIQVISIPAQAKFSGGSGTVQNPYQISTAEDLLDLGEDTNYYSANFILTADINLGGQVFTTAIIAREPGNNLQGPFSGIPFDGNFNGAGHKINNLTIEADGEGKQYLGLFGTVRNGTITGLVLENVRIIGGDNCGDIGGLAGECYGSTINNCSVTGTITGGWAIGGLAGESINNIFNNCSFTGSVTAANCLAGGLAGYCWDHGQINNCYSSGTVTGGFNSHSIGGLFGGFGSDINNSYSSCKVTGGNNFNNYFVTGGLAAQNSCSTKHSYFLAGYGTDNGIGKPLTDSQMKQRASFADWDFAGETADGSDDIWTICEGIDYPKLAWNFTGDCPLVVTKCTVKSNARGDSIFISGLMAAGEDDFDDSDEIKVVISAAPFDDLISICTQYFPINRNTYNGVSYSGLFAVCTLSFEVTSFPDDIPFSIEGIETADKTAKIVASNPKSHFKYNVKTHKFSFIVTKADLTGLCCPINASIQVGTFDAGADMDEPIVNGRVNPIPINLLMGVKNSLRIDKPKFTRNRITGKITQVYTRGGISVEKINDADLTTNPLDITIGSETFTIPVNIFKSVRGKFICSNIPISGGKIVFAVFDFDKGAFRLKIKGTKISDVAGQTDFQMEFGSFKENAKVSLP